MSITVPDVDDDGYPIEDVEWNESGTIASSK